MIEKIAINRTGVFLTLQPKEKESYLTLRNEILYLDGKSTVSDIVRGMSDKLASAISTKREVTICCLGEIFSKKYGAERVLYNYPDMGAVDLPEEIEELTGKIWTKISDSIRPPKFFGVFLYADEDKPGQLFAYFPVTENLLYLLKGMEFFGKYTGLDEKDSVLYSLFSDVDELSDDIDKRFYDDVTECLIEEIAERVGKLRMHGVKEYVIRSLFDHPITLSRVLIDKDLRIILTDWNNMEIKMEPLPKALWLLFLDHPEGMLLKQLSRYRKELMEYYLKTSRRCDMKTAQSSVARLLDPSDNSINEKCSRIKASFVSKFDERLARNYYVDYLYSLSGFGKRQVPPGADPLLKGIPLDRDLVIREF